MSPVRVIVKRKKNKKREEKNPNHQKTQQSWNRNGHFQHFLPAVLFEVTVLEIRRTQVTSLYVVSSFTS